jgi:hypothetical protein
LIPVNFDVMLYADFSRFDLVILPGGRMTPIANKGDSAAQGPLIVDLGKRKRSEIKKLCKGEGDLVGEVSDCIEELKASGAVSSTAQPVVVIIREKRKPRSILWPGL